MTKKRTHKLGVFPKNRDIIVESVSMWRYFNHVMGFMDIDITDALEIFKSYKEKTGEQLSITAWFMRCAAKAASEFELIRTFRLNKRKTVIFEDVDIKCMIEREIEGRKIPIHYIFRAVDKKPFKEFHTEFRSVQQKIDENRENERKIKQQQKLIMTLPKFIRRWFIWHQIMTNPFKHIENLGVIGVSSIGTFGKNMHGWGMARSPHQTHLLLGAIVKKPVQKGEGIEWRDFLNLTVTVNHDIIDGGPGVDFGRRISELMTNCFELDDFIIK